MAKPENQITTFFARDETFVAEQDGRYVENGVNPEYTALLFTTGPQYEKAKTEINIFGIHTVDVRTWAIKITNWDTFCALHVGVKTQYSTMNILAKKRAEEEFTRGMQILEEMIQLNERDKRFGLYYTMKLKKYNYEDRFLSLFWIQSFIITTLVILPFVNLLNELVIYSVDRQLKETKKLLSTEWELVKLKVAHEVMKVDNDRYQKQEETLIMRQLIAAVETRIVLSLELSDSTTLNEIFNYIYNKTPSNKIDNRGYKDRNRRWYPLPPPTVFEVYDRLKVCFPNLIDPRQRPDLFRDGFVLLLEQIKRTKDVGKIFAHPYASQKNIQFLREIADKINVARLLKPNAVDYIPWIDALHATKAGSIFAGRFRSFRLLQDKDHNINDTEGRSCYTGELEED